MEEELLSEYLDRGYSLIPLIQDSKIPAKKWERYQREKTNKEEVQKWNTKGWNIGVVTGKISRLAVVDVDDKSILNELSKKFPEIKKTASVETPRGHHFYFECESPLSPKYNFLDLPKVELKGDGCYVVAPQSVVEDKPYIWEIPLKYIVPLPNRIIEEQRQRIIVDLDILECPYYCGQDVLCIKQILNSNIEEGFRDLSLFVLYNLLLKKRNTPAHAQKIVRFKNKIIRKPLSEKELRKIFKHLHFRDNWLLCSGEGFWEIAAATIEERLTINGDVPYIPSPSREPDEGGRRVCLSGASYADAEKSEWKMALKI